MKQQTTDLIRKMLAGRIGWISDQIHKGSENAATLAREMADLSEALADLVTPVPVAPATMDQVRGPELFRVFSQNKATLEDLAQHLVQTNGKTHPFVMLVKQARAVAFDPYGSAAPAAVTVNDKVVASNAPPLAS